MPPEEEGSGRGRAEWGLKQLTASQPANCSAVDARSKWTPAEQRRASSGQEQSSGGQLGQPAAMWKLPQGPKFHGILLLASRQTFSQIISNKTWNTVHRGVSYSKSLK